MSAIGKQEGRSPLWIYSIGFILSLILTLTVYFVTVASSHGSAGLSGTRLTAFILVFAAVQLLTQLVCFLHVRLDFRSRWNLLALGFAATVLLILVIGSIWIMNNLNYNMISSPKQVTNYMNSQGDL